MTEIGLKRKNKAMTIVELMMAIAVMGVIMGMGSAVLMQGFKMWRQNLVQVEVQRDTRNVMSVIERNVRQAEDTSIAISRNSSSDPYFSKITFEKNRGTFTATTSIYQTGTDIYMTEDNKGNFHLGRNARSLNFVSVESGDASIISIGLCLEKSSFGGRSRASHLAIQKVRVMN
jgi:prepilin-type N-terminal cleavage/methylation domain-containing protein